MGIALVVGVFITLTVSALTLASTFTPFPLTQGPRIWAFLSRHLSHRLCGGIDFKVRGELPTLKNDEIVFLYANHQTSAGLSELVYFVTTYLKRNPVYVVKSDLYPWIRWPIVRLGLAIVIDRNNGEAAKRAIEEALPKLVAEKRAILIFPDGSRWTYNKAEGQRARFRHIPEAQEITQVSLMPKSGGFLQIIHALEGQPYRLVELGNEFSVRTDGLASCRRLAGSTFNVFVQEIPPESLPREDKEREAWLVARFLRITRAIRATREPRPPSTIP